MMRILLIEDHPVVAEMEVEVLSSMDHEVRWAQSAEEGLEVLNVFVPDLMIVDVGLPKMDGRGFARTVRQMSQFNDTPIVALTSLHTEADRQVSLEAGFTEHYVKPMDFDMVAKYEPTLLNTSLQSPAMV